MRRPLLVAAAAVLASALRLGTAPTHAAADAGSPPIVTGLAPRLLVPNGQPLHLTVTGLNLRGVTEVFLNPVIVDRSFAVVGDTTVLVTLPATLAPGDYTITLSSTAGSSSAGDGGFTVDAAPPPAATGPAPPLPHYSFAPIPRTVPEPVTGVLGTVVPSVTPSVVPAGRPLNPLPLLPLGILLGGCGYLLWGRPGRLAAASRQGLVAHLVGRPVQALRVGRICLQCGRFHFILRTRRDLWRAGQFCSATCFVGAQEDDSAARAGEGVATVRMREMFVYSELDRTLQQALAGDATHAPGGLDPGVLESLTEALTAETPEASPVL